MLKVDHIAGLHLTTLPQFHLAIDENPLFTNDRLGLATTLYPAGTLEHLGQIDRLMANFEGRTRLAHRVEDSKEDVVTATGAP